MAAIPGDVKEMIPLLFNVFRMIAVVRDDAFHSTASLDSSKGHPIFDTDTAKRLLPCRHLSILSDPFVLQQRQFLNEVLEKASTVALHGVDLGILLVVLGVPMANNANRVMMLETEEVDRVKEDVLDRTENRRPLVTRKVSWS